jgi:hypothetical protein
MMSSAFSGTGACVNSERAGNPEKAHLQKREKRGRFENLFNNTFAPAGGCWRPKRENRFGGLIHFKTAEAVEKHGRLRKYPAKAGR